VLDECFQVYQWIIKHVHNVFSKKIIFFWLLNLTFSLQDIKLEKIILIGDSIGGNLAIGISQFHFSRLISTISQGFIFFYHKKV